MSNGDVPIGPGGFIRQPPGPGRFREPPRIGVAEAQERRRRAGTLPVVVPLFPPLPSQPVRLPIEFPTGPAANDPIFSQAGRIIRIGNIIVGISIVLDALIRKGQDIRIEKEEREREAIFRKKVRERALERDPIEVIITDPRQAPAPVEFEKPSIPNIPDLPEISPGRFPLEIPGVQIDPEPAAPGRIDIGTVEIPVPGPATAPAPAPVEVPGIGSQPGVFTPMPRSLPLPVGFPVPAPVAFPLFDPIGTPSPFQFADPVGLPRALPSPLTPFEVGTVELPQPLAQPLQDPARRRCKPCKEDNPEPRDKCFKGLYREGRLDTEVDFTEWTEINCETGVEI